MKPKYSLRACSLALALALLLCAAPPCARADDGNPYAVAGVQDVIVKPSSNDGHIRFGVTSDIRELALRGDDGKEVTQSSVLSVADALSKVCQEAFASQSGVIAGSVGLDYISYVSVSAVQGTIYDGYNTEGDTGSGVAGTQKYYYSDAASNYRISNIRFVPKTTFSGRAEITYYGYYHYSTPDETIASKTVVKTGSYAGKIYIVVSKQEPGIAYSTDGEPAKFSGDDFASYAQAVTGRTFKYISFRLPSVTEGTLYYNYIDSSVYDYAVAPAQRFYRADTPSVSKVSFLPAKDYSGDVHIEFTGVDSADQPIVGILVVHVTSYGPSHTQPSAEGPFVYKVSAGRPVSLDAQAFDEQVQYTYGTGESFSYLSFASLPPSDSGTLYYDLYTRTDHVVKTGTSYSSPGSVRFASKAGYSGIVSVPIVITTRSGKSFDSMLRFVITDEGDYPLRYKVEPERRVSLIGSDFADACYDATGYELSYIIFDSLPSSDAGTLYYNEDSPVTTSRNTRRFYRATISDVSFLANASFVGEVSFRFTGYPTNYSTYNGRSFTGTVTIVSKAVVEQKPSIGGTGGTLEYSTWGPAVALSFSDLYRSASQSLAGAPETLSLTRPQYGEGDFYLDFYSLSNCLPFDATKSYPLTDAYRISYLPKAGFSGVATVDYTISDARGNSYTGNLRFVVTPPYRSSYFSDMDDTQWAVQSVDFFRQYGAANGTSGSTFSPSAPMRRGDFVLLLQRLFVFPGASTGSYADVTGDKYYAGAIASAKALGVLTDADARTVPNPAYEAALAANPKAKPRVSATIQGFDPEGAITREDAALYLYRALRQADRITPGSAAELSRFPDAGDVSSAAREAMGTLVRDGVFQGYVNNLLPKRTLSRAETMTILYRAFT